MMTTRELTVRFVTPAFLGDSEKAGARLPGAEVDDEPAAGNEA